MYDWENRLCSRATDRVVRPFEWGLEWTQDWPVTRENPRNGHHPQEYLRVLNRAALESSDDFFGYQPPTDFELDGNLLRFTSAVETPHPENNRVHGQWFPARHKPGSRRVATLVLPHWNASVTQHNALCAGLAKLGISALRLSLPYHDYRMPAELKRADYAVSSNVARTIDATRQAVIDTRSAVDWLQSQGFERIGIVGTSLGSCYAFLASTHDPRLEVNVYNHCSTYFADVVWEGLSTQHIRQSLEPEVTLEQLRDAWMVISPPHYIERYAKLKKKSLFIYARYDTTFPVHFSEQVIAKARELKMDHKAVVLPCGHYTVGEAPFKFLDGYHICNFLKRNL
jgi:dienelactone hydrolase